MSTGEPMGQPRLKHHELPDWPARMRLRLAAAYLDIGYDVFRQGIKDGKYPAGHKDGGVYFWYRHELDKVLQPDAEQDEDLDLDVGIWGPGGGKGGG